MHPEANDEILGLLIVVSLLSFAGREQTWFNEILGLGPGVDGHDFHWVHRRRVEPSYLPDHRPDCAMALSGNLCLADGYYRLSDSKGGSRDRIRHLGDVGLVRLSSIAVGTGLELVLRGSPERLDPGSYQCLRG